MAKKELIFKDLISLLKDIREPEDAPENLFDELINAGLAVGFGNLTRSKEYSEREAFEFLQQLLMAHLERLKENH
jgi:hypothetical protein